MISLYPVPISIYRDGKGEGLLSTPSIGQMNKIGNQ